MMKKVKSNEEKNSSKEFSWERISVEDSINFNVDDKILNDNNENILETKEDNSEIIENIGKNKVDNIIGKVLSASNSDFSSQWILPEDIWINCVYFLYDDVDREYIIEKIRNYIRKIQSVNSDNRENDSLLKIYFRDLERVFFFC
jgi:hypothetical protein